MHTFETIRACAAMLPNDLGLVAQALGFKMGCDAYSSDETFQRLVDNIRLGAVKGADAMNRDCIQVPVFGEAA